MANAIIIINAPTAPTAGTFTLQLYDFVAAPADYDVSAGSLASDLASSDLVTQLGGTVNVSGSALLSGYTIDLQGTMANFNWSGALSIASQTLGIPDLVPAVIYCQDGASQCSDAILIISGGGATSGSYVVSLGSSTYNVNIGSNAGEVATDFEPAVSSEPLVTELAPDVWLIDWPAGLLSGASLVPTGWSPSIDSDSTIGGSGAAVRSFADSATTGSNQELVEIAAVGAAGYEASVVGGTWQIGSTPLAWNATAAQVQAACDGLLGAGAVTVTTTGADPPFPSGSSAFSIEWTSAGTPGTILASAENFSPTPNVTGALWDGSGAITAAVHVSQNGAAAGGGGADVIGSSIISPARSSA